MKIRSESGHTQEAQQLFSLPLQTSTGRLLFVLSESETHWEDAEESGLGRRPLFAFRPFSLAQKLAPGCTATPWLGARREPSPPRPPTWTGSWKGPAYWAKSQVQAYVQPLPGPGAERRSPRSECEMWPFGIDIDAQAMPRCHTLCDFSRKSI